jgi:RNA polymerase sigma factor (sigma-70 family)
MTKRQPESTTELVIKARNGDRTAGNEVAGREMVRLRRWAHGRLPRFARDICDTEDMVQDALLRTWRRIDTLDVSKAGNLHSYTRQTVKNSVIDQVRRAIRRPQDDEVDDLADSRPAPDVEAARRETQTQIKVAMARLTPTEQKLIKARVDKEWPYDVIARKLGKPSPEAARVAVHRACKRLLAELQRDLTRAASGPRRRPR